VLKIAGETTVKKKKYENGAASTISDDFKLDKSTPARLQVHRTTP